MRKIPRTRLAPEDLAVIAYHEDNGDLVILRFSHGQERDICTQSLIFLSTCICPRSALQIRKPASTPITPI